MGNKLKSKSRNDPTEETKDEQIMVDMYDITAMKADTSHSTTATTATQTIPSTYNSRYSQSGTLISSLHKSHTPTSSETRHSIFDSKLPDDADIEVSQRPSLRYRTSSSIIMKMEKLIKPTATQIDEEITEKLLIEEMEQKYSLNILISGSQQSGKTIIFKQMEKAFLGEIEEKQMEYALETMRVNIVSDIIDLCKYNNQLSNDYKYQQEDQDEEEEEKYFGDEIICDKNKGNIYKLKNQELQEICFRLATLDGTSLQLSRQLAIEIDALWNDDAMQETFNEAKHLDIMNDNTRYFLDRALDIVDEEYITTFDDYVRIKDNSKHQSGVSQKKFLIETKYGKYRFNVTQINGQRSERRRWSQWLDNINVVVYVVNLSAYDINISHNDKKINCLRHSIHLFQSICNDKTFNNTDFVIFFNKINEFDDKIRYIPFTEFNENFDTLLANKGVFVKDYVMAEYKKIFAKTNDAHNRKKGNIYFHEVNDSDTEQIGLLLQKVQTDVVASAMKRMGYVF